MTWEIWGANIKLRSEQMFAQIVRTEVREMSEQGLVCTGGKAPEPAVRKKEGHYDTEEETGG